MQYLAAVIDARFVPAVEVAKSVAESAFQQLSPRARMIRLRLCHLVEQSAEAAAEGEDLGVLRAASYLQEIGVIHSSRSKPVYSLQMCAAFFADDDELDERLIDCIRNHEIDGHPCTAEGRLMRICHKYVVTHYLDYMIYKHQLAPGSFDRLQDQRIEDYRRHIREHPRGPRIEQSLRRLFLRPSDVPGLMSGFLRPAAGGRPAFPA